MKHYTFLRHAQSIYNRDGVSGRDPELTDTGRETALQLKGKYDFALVSCMRRTRETFNGAPGIEADVVLYSTLCREKMSGSRHDSSNLMEGEENVDEDDEEFEYRMSLLKKYLRHLGKQYETILIVCHAGVIESITGERAHNGESYGLNEL